MVTRTPRAARRMLIAVLAAALSSLVVAGPTGSLAAEPDCSIPDIAAVRAQLVAAELAAAAGDQDTAVAALESARADLSVLIDACTAGPGSSFVPVDLGGLLRLETLSVRFPTTLMPLEADLIDGEDGAEAVTIADSPETGDLVEGSLDAPLPESTRAIAIVVGDPAAVIASVGVPRSDAPRVTSVSRALVELTAQLAAESASGSLRMTGGEVRTFRFPDESDGAEVDVTLIDEGGTVLASARFLLRALDPDHWAMAVAVAAPDTMPRLAHETRAVLGSVELLAP